VRMANDMGTDLLYLVPRYVHILNDRTMSALEIRLCWEDFLPAFGGCHNFVAP